MHLATPGRGGLIILILGWASPTLSTATTAAALSTLALTSHCGDVRLTGCARDGRAGSLSGAGLFDRADLVRALVAVPNIIRHVHGPLEVRGQVH